MVTCKMTAPDTGTTLRKTNEPIFVPAAQKYCPVYEKLQYSNSTPALDWRSMYIVEFGEHIGGRQAIAGVGKRGAY